MQAWVLFVACGASVPSDPESSSGTDTEVTAAFADLRVPGAVAYTEDSGASEVGEDCLMEWRSWEPETRTGPDVVLSHGFLRSSDNVADWAEHYASWGVGVVAPSLCHLSITDADHAANGAELVALVEVLGLDAPVYVGHSAGGLASLLAAASDPSAVGLVGLDLVDSDELGLAAAPSVAAPTFALAADPGACNAEGNGLDAVALIDGSRVAHLTGATHCDLESPSDDLCEALCGGEGSEVSSEEQRDAVRALSLAAVLASDGDAASEQDWWEADGEGYLQFTDGHVILE